MTSRDKILAAVAQNQPAKVQLPDVNLFETGTAGSLENFTNVLSAIGGKAYGINDLSEIDSIITNDIGIKGRVVNLVEGLNLTNAEEIITDAVVHHLHNVEMAIIKASLGVAENGAVWVTEDNMNQRVLPFICQHLAVVVHQKDLVPTMHDAYKQLDQMSACNYGSFIAGPSKTADIEQSLVIGAHGPRSMVVFVLK